MLVLKLIRTRSRSFVEGVPPASEPAASRGVIVGQSTTPIVDAAVRLVESMAHPVEAEVLAPLVVDEILLRLLLCPIARVARIGRRIERPAGGRGAVVAVRAFPEPITLDGLADLAHMSVSSFHQHFKAVTAMTPLHTRRCSDSRKHDA